MAKEKKFDIIVMDIVMLAMDSYQLLKELKKTKKMNIPVIVLSNSSQNNEVSGAKKYEIRVYLREMS